MKKKLKDTGGLTMVEMLCATAILVLLILMMNTGINMAVKSYRDITAESEVELLLSSLTDALTDKLRYCVVTVDKDGKYKETSVGTISQIEDADGKLPVTAVNITDGKVTVGGKQLLPDGAYGATGKFRSGYIGNYKVQDDLSVTFDPDHNTFAVKFTVESEETSITRTADFTVRCLNPVKKEE